MTEPQEGELEYGSILPNGEDWRLRKFAAGMGETEYRIFRNDTFFAMFDNRQDADMVMKLMTADPAISAEKVLEDLKYFLIAWERTGREWFYECADLRVDESGDSSCHFQDTGGSCDYPNCYFGEYAIQKLKEQNGEEKLRQQEAR